ncbi:AraC family transcriptional regulator [Flavobacterium sp. RSP15]|uniref:AraC family transcriptional regulator n=1 Tax=Flavobacterium sp. RSP15 TaxID=2497485 RepID=UPI000F818A3D|nr:AraC family transcriptional regulator [Flavobacterium sp. RSP15]RTY87418.1 helix-turn-helix domain-containing protein [Flavobacterium sp. RSP15]
MKKNYLILLLLCFFISLNAQKKFIIPDSLSNKDCNYFNEKINYKESDSLKERLYAQSWLAKAKSERNDKQIALAYKSLIYKFDKKLRHLYADSLVIAAKRTNSAELIGSAYMTKGIVYYDDKKMMKALDNYLIADDYISKTNDEYLIYKLKYCKALTKYYLGFYHEAISLFKECVTYFKEQNDHAYVNSLYSLGQCYSRVNKYQLSSQINQIGIKAAIQFEIFRMKSYFLFSEGINQSFKHNYVDAIKKLSLALPDIKSNKDFANETLAYFYIGKNYWSQNQKEKAVAYFKKVDIIFQQQNYISPELREAYELLIDYSLIKNDKKAHLIYVDQLLKIDQLLEHNYKYLSGKITKVYDTEKLLQTQRNLENSNNSITIIAISTTAVLMSIISFLVYRHFRSKKLFQELMNRQPATSKLFVANGSKELDINPEVVAAILKKLEKFEISKKYLEKEMNLLKLASLLNTNTKYASKIIAKYRNKGIIEYITDLKIDHIIELLKSENKYRIYKNKSLAEEAGFGSTQNFTRAFKSRTGISPSYFCTELNKSIAVNN